MPENGPKTAFENILFAQRERILLDLPSNFRTPQRRGKPRRMARKCWMQPFW
jgi:hypothetical protein